MVAIRKVLTQWTGIAGTPHLSTMFFTQSAGTAQQNVDNVDTFWNAMLGSIDNSLTYTVLGDVQIIDDSTGLVIGLESATPQVGTGSVSTAVTPPATQGLINMRTGTFISGRGLRGKVYVPGVPVTAATADGRPTAAYTTLLTNAGQGLITNSTANGPWRVFSRTHLQSWAVTSATAWTDFAVLRSRRQ